MRNPAGSSYRRTRGVITVSYYVPFRDIIRLASERHAAKYAATKVRNGCANVFRPYEANSFATSKILRCPVTLG